MVQSSTYRCSVILVNADLSEATETMYSVLCGLWINTVDQMLRKVDVHMSSCVKIKLVCMYIFMKGALSLLISCEMLIIRSNCRIC